MLAPLKHCQIFLKFRLYMLPLLFDHHLHLIDRTSICPFSSVKHPVKDTQWHKTARFNDFPLPSLDNMEQQTLLIPIRGLNNPSPSCTCRLYFCLSRNSLALTPKTKNYSSFCFHFSLFLAPANCMVLSLCSSFYGLYLSILLITNCWDYRPVSPQWTQQEL